jgi:hypothetical protein
MFKVFLFDRLVVFSLNTGNNFAAHSPPSVADSLPSFPIRGKEGSGMDEGE